MEVRQDGTVLKFDDEGVDVVWEGHEFRLRRRVVERAAAKDYLDVTDHEVMRMIDRDAELDPPARRIGDLI